MKMVRPRLSKSSAELRRLKGNGRFTKITKKNREEMAEECGEITHYSLASKVKKRLRYLAKKRKRKICSEKV